MMKNLRIFAIDVVMISIVIAFVSGCSKEHELNLPEEASVASLRLAYNNASVYNDSLITYAHDTGLKANDSIKWIGMIHYYDLTYHHYDDSFTSYKTECQQQLSSSGMMSNGMAGNNVNSSANYQSYTDCITKMNALHQLHQSYHP